jgi:hypothetical protein
MRPNDHLVEPFLSGLGHEPGEGERASAADGGAGPRRAARPAPLRRLAAWALLLVALGVLVAIQAL